MTTLVTGGAGYIGSVTAELLHRTGEPVVVLDDLSLGHAAAVAGLPLVRGSIDDVDLVRSLVADVGIDGCIHFAALSSVGESVRRPRRYFEHNVAETVALLGALLDGGVRRFVLSSTAAVYGEPRQTPITEDEPKSPVNPYGRTKLFMEQILGEYDRGHALRSVALRYFNAAGATERLGEDHRPETHLIPRLLAAAGGGEPGASVFGTDYPTSDGTAVRDFVHVADLAEAHRLSLEYLRAGGETAALNLGNGRGFSVAEVVATAKEVTGIDFPVEGAARRPGDPPVLVASNRLARAVLGWDPRSSELGEIVGSAWAWMQRHPQGYGD